ncbi:uncharacterized protein LOC129739336 [Uranotaenia lowii]|uniref:uncharacterized protein LOC129739336 n=1 Tax=Uranotaenia lowii TaxID=190385 RepID=UPI0024799CFA|nr:uncharacterized protein LOC129739336 [Uranotaenia lowii]
MCPPREAPPCVPASRRYRTHDGTCNNRRRPRWGSAQMPFHRFLAPEYADGVEGIRRSLNGNILPSARFVSLVVHGARQEEAPVTMMLALWGQLLDHDLTATAQPRSLNGSTPRCCGQNDDDLHPSCLPIKVPIDDPWLSPLGVRCLEFLRSAPAQRRDCLLSWREQTNQVTSYIDASPIYSSSPRSSDNARIFRDGQLLFGRGPPSEDVCFRAALANQCIRPGDARSGEQPGLMMLHMIWVNEHNQIAARLSNINPHWSDEKLYQETRRIVGAMFQHITYREFLPVILGKEVSRLFDLELTNSGFYTGYDPEINPTISNEFAAAAFRFGHSLIQGSYLRADSFHRFIPNNVTLHDESADGDLGGPGSLHRLIRGMVNQRALKRDEFITPELTNHLFQTKNFPFGLDLAAINIQRGRDHGIQPYVNWRVPCGLTPIRDFDDLERVMGPASALRLRKAYRSVDDIDLFVGGLAERPVVGGVVGPTFSCIIAQQFSNLRKGDRFWYENPGFESSFTPAQLESIRQVAFSQVLCRSLGGGTMQPHVFLPTDRGQNDRIPCDSKLMSPIDLEPWTELDPSVPNNFINQDAIPFSTTSTARTPVANPNVINKVDFIPNANTGVQIPPNGQIVLNTPQTATTINNKLDINNPVTSRPQSFNGQRPVNQNRPQSSRPIVQNQQPQSNVLRPNQGQNNQQQPQVNAQRPNQVQSNQQPASPVINNKLDFSETTQKPQRKPTRKTKPKIPDGNLSIREDNSGNSNLNDNTIDNTQNNINDNIRLEGNVINLEKPIENNNNVPNNNGQNNRPNVVNNTVNNNANTLNNRPNVIDGPNNQQNSNVNRPNTISGQNNNNGPNNNRPNNNGPNNNRPNNRPGNNQPTNRPNNNGPNNSRPNNNANNNGQNNANNRPNNNVNNNNVQSNNNGPNKRPNNDGDNQNNNNRPNNNANIRPNANVNNGLNNGNSVVNDNRPNSNANNRPNANVNNAVVNNNNNRPNNNVNNNVNNRPNANVNNGENNNANNRPTVQNDRPTNNNKPNNSGNNNGNKRPINNGQNNVNNNNRPNSNNNVVNNDNFNRLNNSWIDHKPDFSNSIGNRPNNNNNRPNNAINRPNNPNNGPNKKRVNNRPNNNTNNIGNKRPIKKRPNNPNNKPPSQNLNQLKTVLNDEINDSTESEQQDISAEFDTDIDETLNDNFIDGDSILERTLDINLTDTKSHTITKRDVTVINLSKLFAADDNVTLSRKTSAVRRGYYPQTTDDYDDVNNYDYNSDGDPPVYVKQGYGYGTEPPPPPPLPPNPYDYGTTLEPPLPPPPYYGYGYGLDTRKPLRATTPKRGLSNKIISNNQNSNGRQTTPRPQTQRTTTSKTVFQQPGLLVINNSKPNNKPIFLSSSSSQPSASLSASPSSPVFLLSSSNPSSAASQSVFSVDPRPQFSSRPNAQPPPFSSTTFTQKKTPLKSGLKELRTSDDLLDQLTFETDADYESLVPDSNRSEEQNEQDHDGYLRPEQNKYEPIKKTSDMETYRDYFGYNKPGKEKTYVIHSTNASLWTADNDISFERYANRHQQPLHHDDDDLDQFVGPLIDNSDMTETNVDTTTNPSTGHFDTVIEITDKVDTKTVDQFDHTNESFEQLKTEEPVVVLGTVATKTETKTKTNEDKTISLTAAGPNIELDKSNDYDNIELDFYPDVQARMPDRNSIQSVLSDDEPDENKLNEDPTDHHLNQPERPSTNQLQKRRRRPTGNQTRRQPGIAMVPFVLLTSIERPDNWLMFNVAKSKKRNPLPEVPQLKSDIFSLSELPKPIVAED